MSAPTKPDKASRSNPDDVQLATAREVKERRQQALRELADSIMREDRAVLRKLAD